MTAISSNPSGGSGLPQAYEAGTENTNGPRVWLECPDYAGPYPSMVAIGMNGEGQEVKGIMLPPLSPEAEFFWVDSRFQTCLNKRGLGAAFQVDEHGYPFIAKEFSIPPLLWSDETIYLEPREKAKEVIRAWREQKVSHVIKNEALRKQLLQMLNAGSRGASLSFKEQARQGYLQLGESLSSLDRHETLLIVLTKVISESGINPLHPDIDPDRLLEEALEGCLSGGDEQRISRQLQQYRTQCCFRVRETFHMMYREFEGIPGLKDIAPEHRHRFMIDPDRLRAFEETRQKTGVDVSASPYAVFLFEEKGYAYGMACGLMDALRDPDRPLTPDLMMRIHKAGRRGDPDIPSGFATIKVEWSKREGETLSVEGEREYRAFARNLKKKFLGEPFIYIQTETLDSGKRRLTFFHTAQCTPENMEMLCTEWCDDYAAELRKIGDGNDPKSKNLRLIAGLHCLQKSIRIHPVADGSGRMFHLLLMRLLAQLKEPLASLNHPGQVPGISLYQLFRLVRTEQRAAQPWMRPIDVDGSNLSCADLDDEEYERHFTEYITAIAQSNDCDAQPIIQDDADDASETDSQIIDFTNMD